MSVAVIAIIILFFLSMLLTPALLGLLLRLLWRKATPGRVASVAALPFSFLIVLRGIPDLHTMLADSFSQRFGPVEPIWLPWAFALLFTGLVALMAHRMCSVIAELGVALVDKIRARKNRQWVPLNASGPAD